MSYPVRCQIRTVTGDDRLSRFVLAEKELNQKLEKTGRQVDNILTSMMFSVPTKFVFDEPVYLVLEHYMPSCLGCRKSINYTVWLGQQGKNC